MKFGLRTPSWTKTFGAYRSQWKRSLMRLFFPKVYGKRGMGWLTNPRKAAYNWWYNRTSFSIYQLFGIKRGGGFGFACFLAASIICFPVDMISSGTKASRIKKARKQRAISQGTTNKRKTREGDTRSASTHTATSAARESQARSTSTSAARTTPSSIYDHTQKTVSNTASSTVTSTAVPQGVVKPAELYSTQAKSSAPANEEASVTLPYINAPATKPIEHETTPKEPLENTPKSKPKHECDQYIRKRMIVAGSSYCDKTVLDKLSVGAYIELVPEPDNAYDKDAIMLTLEGAKIGYVAKSDKAAYVTCIKLGRSVYGVITDINTDVFPTQYEYETWFDCN